MKKTNAEIETPAKRAIAMLFFGALFGFMCWASTVAFIDGRPLTGKNSDEIMRRFHLYGDTAFSADHVVFLIVAAWTGGFVLLSIYLALTAKSYDVTKKSLQVIRHIIFAGIYIASFVAIGLLINYQATGVGFRNFEADEWVGKEASGFGLAYVIAAFSVLLATIIQIGIHMGLKKKEV